MSETNNVKVQNSTIVSSSDDSAYAGGLLGYSESNSSSFANIQIINSKITSKEVEGIKSAKWVGFKYTNDFDMTQFVSYASQGVGNTKITYSSSGNIVSAKVQSLQEYQSSDNDYAFADFVSSIDATGHNGGAGAKKDYITLAGQKDPNCISRISASYCMNNGDLKAKKRLYYVWTDANTNPSDRYNSIDGSIRTKICGVRQGADFLLANSNDDDIVEESNFTGTWNYTYEVSWKDPLSGEVIYRKNSTDAKKLYMIGNLEGFGHVIWIKTSYVKYVETEITK